jgi:hypothetical protein
MQLLASSVICPGIIPMIWALLTSNTTGKDSDLEPDNGEIEFLNLSKQKKNQQLIKNIKYQNVKPPESLWRYNYLTGTKYEMYRLPLKQKTFEGLKFKEVAMIMFHKLNITLLALEVKVGNEIRVFVNPYDYILDE